MLPQAEGAVGFGADCRCQGVVARFGENQPAHVGDRPAVSAHVRVGGHPRLDGA